MCCQHVVVALTTCQLLLSLLFMFFLYIHYASFFYLLILIHSLIRYIRKELKRVLSLALWTVSAVRCSLKLFLRSFKLSLYNLLISYCHSFSNPKNSVDSHLQFPRSSRSVCRLKVGVTRPCCSLRNTLWTCDFHHSSVRSRVCNNSEHIF